MNALNFLFLVAGAIYGVFVDGTFWKIYFVLVVLYTIFHLLTRNQRENTKRKNIMISTWSGKTFELYFIYFFCVECSDPTSYVTNELVMDKVLEYTKALNTEQKDVHITATHILGHALAWALYK